MSKSSDKINNWGGFFKFFAIEGTLGIRAFEDLDSLILEDYLEALFFLIFLTTKRLELSKDFMSSFALLSIFLISFSGSLTSLIVIFLILPICPFFSYFDFFYLNFSFRFFLINNQISWIKLDYYFKIIYKKLNIIEYKYIIFLIIFQLCIDYI